LACPPTAARRRDLGCLSTISMVDIQTGERTRRPRQIGRERLEPIVNMSPRTSDVEDSSRALPRGVPLDPAHARHAANDETLSRAPRSPRGNAAS